jgi:hypothetical protein
LEWIRGSNTFYTLTAGIAALMVPCIASSALRILGLGFFTGLLAFVGSVVVFLAVAIGFGAVLLTRGGRIRSHESYFDFEDDFWTDSRTETTEESAAGWRSEGPVGPTVGAEPETPDPENAEARDPGTPAPGASGDDEPPPGPEEDRHA